MLDNKIIRYDCGDDEDILADLSDILSATK
jgi:hypothetical protein